MNRRMKLRGTQTIGRNSLSNINIAHEMNSTFLRANSRASVFYYYDLFTDRPVLILRVMGQVVHVPRAATTQAVRMFPAVAGRSAFRTVR